MDEKDCICVRVLSQWEFHFWYTNDYIMLPHSHKKITLKSKCMWFLISKVYKNIGNFVLASNI